MTNTALELWSPNINRGHLAADTTSIRGHFLQLWLCKHLLSWGQGSKEEQAKTAQTRLLGICQQLTKTAAGKGPNPRSQWLWGTCTHISNNPCSWPGRMEQGQWVVELLHPSWPWVTKVPFLWPWHRGTEHPSHLAFALRLFGLGEATRESGGIISDCDCAGRLELSNAALARPLCCPKPPPLSPVICCSAPGPDPHRGCSPSLSLWLCQEWQWFNVNG